MKRIMLVVVLLLAPAAIPSLLAQNHGEFGLFADYFRHGESGNRNLWGLGARLSFNVHDNVQLEAEMAYDFNRWFSEGFTRPTTGVVVTERSHLRALHGLFGPKLQTGGGSIRAFGTIKAGFTSFSFDDRPATFRTFASTVDELRNDSMSFALYPGVGLELYAWIIGIRLDVGDEIYFRDGAKNNLKITLGPHFRF